MRHKSPRLDAIDFIELCSICLWSEICIICSKYNNNAIEWNWKWNVWRVCHFVTCVISYYTFENFFSAILFLLLFLFSYNFMPLWGRFLHKFFFIHFLFLHIFCHCFCVRYFCCWCVPWLMDFCVADENKKKYIYAVERVAKKKSFFVYVIIDALCRWPDMEWNGFY